MNDIIQTSLSKTTLIWLNWNSHKEIEGIVTSPGSWGTENNQIVNHFGVLHCVHRSGLWSAVKQSDNYGEISTAPWLPFSRGLYKKQDVYLLVRFEESRILSPILKHLMERHQNK